MSDAVHGPIAGARVIGGRNRLKTETTTIMFMRKIMTTLALGALIAGSGCSTTDAVQTASSLFGNDALVSGLTSGLGLDARQVAGGLGGLMSLAKSSLPTSDFLSLAGYLPNADQYLKFANDAGILSGPLKSVSDLSSTMDSLGVSPSQATDMFNQVGKYIGDAGGAAQQDMLMGLLR